jgi:hypothetical protein
MDKKPSFWWSLAVGLAFPILQVVIYLIRFGSLDSGAAFIDYIGLFIAGALIGLGLIYFLRKSDSGKVLRAVIIGFVIGLPFSVFGMVVGGMVGVVGVILLSVSPSIFTTGVGYYLGKALTKNRAAVE